MRHIQSLVKELCPEGVEYKELGEVIEINAFNQIGAAEIKDLSQGPGGEVKLLPSSRNYDWWSDEIRAGDRLCEGEVITLGRARYANIKYHKGKFISSNNWIVSAADDQRISGRYLYHFIDQYADEFYVVASTYPKLDKDSLLRFPIPIPPPEVQEAIVEYLDKFSELEAELEAELSHRQKQYQWYRTHLLDFKRQELGEEGNPTDIVLDYQYASEYSKRPGVEDVREMVNELCPGGVEWKGIEDIGQLVMCKRVLKSQTQPRGEVPFYKIGTFGRDANAFISKNLFQELSEKYSFPSQGDILISASGTIGRLVVYNGEEGYFQDSNIIWLQHQEQDLLNRFLRHYFLNWNWPIQKSGTIDRLYITEFKKQSVPVPPLPVQEAIADILDNFYTLVSDMNQGIPAEIAARRKQYEYYREQLLTFNPKSTNEPA